MFVAIIGFSVGFVTGFLISRKGLIQKQIGGDNAVQVQEVLIDASANKEIAEICANDDSSEKNKIFNEITKRINKAALNGAKRIYLGEDYGLNKRVRKYLTKEEINEYFNPSKYVVHYIYIFEYPDIDFINWE